MNDLEIIERTVSHVRQELADAEGGHDWFHINRVWQLSKIIADGMDCDMVVVELGALLHDIADSKFHGGDDSIGPKKAREFLTSLHLDSQKIEAVVDIIEHISFSGGNKAAHENSVELDIVQDADRIDALGAIGIARTFNYGGFKNRKLYDPEIKPVLGMDPETYKKSMAPTINHFYEKLLLLKDRMNTVKGKEIAEKRHKVMVDFLDQFYAEWHVGEESGN